MKLLTFVLPFLYTLCNWWHASNFFFKSPLMGRGLDVLKYNVH